MLTRVSPSAAKNQAASNPENTIFDIKRLIGRKYSEKDVQNEYVIYNRAPM